jgi:hypothetical protein
MSWEELESLDKTDDIREAKQQREDLSRLCLRVFGTEDGLKLLEWLRQMYVDVPIAVPGTDASYAYFADGQRAVIRDLEARIQQARSL